MTTLLRCQKTMWPFSFVPFRLEKKISRKKMRSLFLCKVERRFFLSLLLFTRFGHIQMLEVMKLAESGLRDDHKRGNWKRDQEHTKK